MASDGLDASINNQSKLVSSEKQLTPKQIVDIGNKLWKQIKDTVKSNPKFKEFQDKNKLEYFRADYKEFMEEFPIVTRYMICMGQYSAKAFDRFLNKLRTAVHPPPDKREKGYMEDQWIRRQADYVRYLWEAYQKGRYNNEEAKWVWQDTYKKLKGEFDDFRDKYKEIEQSVKDEKKNNDARNARDLLERLATGHQSLPENDQAKLLLLLKDKLYKRRFSNVMDELAKNKPALLPTCEGLGNGIDEAEISKDKPTIKMIEYVDHNRMNEVPKELIAKADDYPIQNTDSPF